MEEWKPLPSLSVARWGAGSCYLNKTLIVGGGVISYGGPLKSIEMLPMEASDNAPEWEMSTSTLPYGVSGHTIVPFNNKLMLIGGWAVGSGVTNRVWEGTLNKSNKVS